MVIAPSSEPSELLSILDSLPFEVTSMRRMQYFFLFITLLCANVQMARADLILSGSANLQFDGVQLFNQTGLTPVWYYDASNGAGTATSAEILAIFFGSPTFQGGGAAITAAPVYNLDHPIILGTPTNPTGRVRQSTNADLDPNNPLTTWSSGERIGIDGVTIFSVGASGIAAGDYSLEYSTLQNRLSLVNHVGGTVEAFRVNNPTFATTANGFTISGDLLTGDFFPLNGFSADLDVGAFTLNAITAVPEPSSFILIGIAGLGMGMRQRWKAKKGNSV